MPRFATRFLLCIFIRLMLLPLVGWSLSVAAQDPKIEIKGGSESLRENIKHFLSLYDESCKTSPWRLRSLLRDAAGQIQEAARALGYYHLEYEEEFTEGEKCWSLVLRLKPGPRVRINDVSILLKGEAADDPLFRALAQDPGLEKGDKLNHARYESLKNRLKALASNRGYFDGKFARSRVAVDLKKNTADVELIYDSGQRYRFGKINLEQDILDEDFAQRYIEIKEGDYYETEKLLLLKNKYNASNFFSLASVSPDLQNMENGVVPINITLEPRKRHSYSVGAGVATDTGPRFLLGFEDHYFNRKGHSLRADLSASEINTTFEAAYTIPMTRPAQEFLKIYYGYEQEDTEVSLSNLYTVGSSYTRLEDNQWLYTYALNYEREDSIAGNEEEKRTHLVIPSVSMSRTKTDGNLTYPLRGWNFLTRLSGSPQTFGSDVSFVQLYARGKHIRPFAKGRLLLRLEAGVTNVDEFTDLPVSVRFFTGGDASVRGYDYRSLGGEDGLVAGGSNLLVSSIEYDYLIKPRWAIAAFYDQGNASNDSSFEFKRSAGLGVRWISPIGPVRIDVAKALDDEKSWALHLSMGPDL